MFSFAAHKKLKASVIADNYHQQHAASNTFVITRQCIAPAKVATASVCDHFFATKSLRGRPWWAGGEGVGDFEKNVLQALVGRKKLHAAQM